MTYDCPVGLAEQLQALVKPDIVETPNDGVLELRDTQAGMSYALAGVPPGTVALRVDMVGHLTALENGCYPLRRCDFLVVSPTNANEADLAVLVELKTTLSHDNGPREQLRRSLPILRYLQCACEVHFRNQAHVHESYVLIGRKLHTRFDKQAIRLVPGRHEVEDYNGISIKRLIGAGSKFSDLI